MAMAAQDAVEDKRPAKELADMVSLKMMAEGKIEGVNKVTHYKLDPHIIEVEQGFNIRFMTPARREYIDGIKTAMRAGAKFPPLDVRIEGGRIILVDGHNRLIAILELIDEGVEILFVEVRQFSGNDADRVAHMVGTGQQGLPLSQLEQGHGFRRLQNFGWPLKRIANHIGKSETLVEKCVMLAEADTEIQQMLVREEVSADVVVDVLRRHRSRALEVLRALLAKAQNAGSRKVTERTLHGPSIPRDVVGKVVASLSTFYQRLPEGEREKLETLLQGNEAELEGQTITLDAASLKGLFDAHHDVRAVFAKAERRDELRRQRAAKAGHNDAPAQAAELADWGEA
ncbi:hypothetical protein AB4Y43_17175 [Paraburkholderia sp. BR10872]|uniref:hypothetical protein n=1 Tax=Paraburkholderia sp. BR10872 TaxID=3236989 RepID=UPI0034D2C106